MIRFLYFLQAGLLLVFAYQVGAVCYAQRGVPVAIKDPSGSTVISYAESHALLIGVSRYDHKNWRTLPGVAEDLDSLKAVFEYQKFHTVTVVKDPTREELEQKVTAFIRKHGYQPNKRLVFWIAGHGRTHVANKGDSLGYFLPKDTPAYNPNGDNQAFFEKAIPLTKFDAWAQEIQALHVLFVFDACFAGNIIEVNRDGNTGLPKAIAERLNKPVRLYMTSGSAHETVPDESEFRKAFCEALRGKAGGAEADGYLTGSELGEYLYNRVLNRVGRHPQIGKARRRSEQGDLVFSLSTLSIPPKERPNLDDLQTQATLESQWHDWQQDMEAFFAQVQGIDQGKASAATKQQAWEQFLNGFKENNPYSQRDEALRQTATQRLGYWKSPPAAVSVLPITAREKRFTNSIGMKFVLVGKGSFMMGSPDSDKEASSEGKPQHRVNITKDFYVGQYEVTQAEWEAVMGNEDFGKRTCQWGSFSSGFIGDNKPMICVSWEEAQEFIRRLNEKEGTTRYRLLTEAEWEYAARAGSSSRYAWGNEIGRNQANCAGCGSRWDNKETAPVGSFSANAWGLSDMHGNVWEWVQDWYQGDYYKNSPSSDPSNLTKNSNTYRVLRGGSWYGIPRNLRAAYRYGSGPSDRGGDVGFRLAKTL